MKNEPNPRRVGELEQQVVSLRERVAQVVAERDLLLKRRRRQILIVGAMVSLLCHITLMLILSSLYREGGSKAAPQPIAYDFAIIQDEELTELESVELDDLMAESLEEIQDIPQDSTTAELVADVTAAELEVTNTGSVPVLGGSGDGTGGVGTLDGGGAGTSFFGVSSQGTRFAYIVDRSGSMGQQNKMEVAMRELSRSIDALPDYAFFFVVLFSSSEEEPPMQRGWARADRTRIRNFVRWLTTVAPRGGTRPRSAFELVFELEQRPDVIFFLTDGEISGFGAEDVKLLNGRGKRVVINTIAFGDPSSQDMLKKIAADSGGVYKFVPSGGP